MDLYLCPLNRISLNQNVGWGTLQRSQFSILDNYFLHTFNIFINFHENRYNIGNVCISSDNKKLPFLIDLFLDKPHPFYKVAGVVLLSSIVEGGSSLNIAARDIESTFPCVTGCKRISHSRKTGVIQGRCHGSFEA